MKKFIKFLLAVGSLAGLAAGGYYVYKNYIEKKDADLDEFDEDEDFEDFGDESREYVSINISSDETNAAEEAQEEAPAENNEENF